MIATRDAQSLQDSLKANAPSPIHYNSPKPEAALEEDKIIERLPLKISADSISVIPADRIFE